MNKKQLLENLSSFYESNKDKISVYQLDKMEYVISKLDLDNFNNNVGLEFRTHFDPDDNNTICDWFELRFEHKGVLNWIDIYYEDESLSIHHFEPLNYYSMDEGSKYTAQEIIDLFNIALNATKTKV